MAIINPLNLPQRVRPAIAQLMKRAHSQILPTFDLFESTDYLNAKRQLVLTLHHVIHDDLYFHPNPTHRQFEEMVERIRRALLIREPTVKARKVERRLMLARAGQARKSKARRLA